MGPEFLFDAQRQIALGIESLKVGSWYDVLMLQSKNCGDASSAPDAPSAWLCKDFVEVTFKAGA